MSQFFIYGLADPDTKIIRYVGQTNNLKKRYQYHTWEAANGFRNRKNNWVRSVQNRGSQPEMIILEENSTREDSNEAEVRIIGLLKDCGFDLTNATSGGDGAFERSRESISRQQESRRGYKPSAETRRKTSESHKKRFADNPELCKDMARRNPNLPANDRKGQEVKNSKLTDEIVANIRRQLKSGKGITEVAANWPDISMAAVHAAGKGKTWAHVTEPPYQPRKIGKLTDQNVIDIKDLLAQGYTCTAISKQFNVNKSSISAIKRGER